VRLGGQGVAQEHDGVDAVLGDLGADLDVPAQTARLLALDVEVGLLGIRFPVVPVATTSTVESSGRYARTRSIISGFLSSWAISATRVMPASRDERAKSYPS